MMRRMSRSMMSWWWRTARSFRLRRTNAAHRRPRRCCARPIRRSARPTPAHGQRQQAEHDDHDGDADHGGQDVADHVRQPLQRIVRQQRIPREAVGDVLRHIIQPRRAHEVLGTPFTPRIAGGQQTDRRQLDYTELGMWRNFTHCGVLYAHVPEVDPLASPPAPRDAAGPTAEPATAADPDMSAEAVHARIEAARIKAETNSSTTSDPTRTP